jgi:recombination protein RecT
MAVNNSLAKSHNQSQSKLDITAYLTRDAAKKQINQVIGGKDGQRFITAIISATQTNKTLQECSNASILSAALQGEALKLPPSPQLGYYFMVPFNNKKSGTKEAQFQLSAKGYKQLAMRSGQYKDLDVIYIHQGEYKGRDKETGKQLFEFIQDDVEREALPVIGYLGYFELLNGFRKQIFWTKERMEKHADTYSMAFSLSKYKDLQEGKIPERDMWKYSSFWYKNFDEMAEKTMIRQLLSKWGILSIDMMEAYSSDMSVIREDGTYDYVDTEPVNAETEPQAEIPTEATEVIEEPGTIPEAKEPVQEANNNSAMNALFS